MITQAKTFTLRLIMDLLEAPGCANNTNIDKNTDIVKLKFENNIAQNIIYCVEHEDGEMEFLANSIIEKLIDMYKNEEHIRTQRFLAAFYPLQVCIMSVVKDTTQEEIELFRTLATS